MKINEKDVRKIATLARLKFNAKEETKLTHDLNQILTWVDQLDSIDTKSVDPMTSVNLKCMPLNEDVVTDGDYVNSIIQNAPESKFDMFVVPKVVE